MSSGTAKILISIGIVVALILIYIVVGISYKNTEVRLRNQIGAQQESNEAVFDNTWKIISQQADISSEYRDAFKEIYPELMEGRYGNARGGSLMSFIHESNPNFDTSLYEKLSASVEGQRTVFTREQQKLIDLKREHDNIRMTFPGSFFVGDRAAVAINIVKSERTNTIFIVGEENEVDLFKKD
jgi:hypothetical protein